jgi:hypothetical protein
MYQASVPAFLQTIGALDAILDKLAAHAAARKIDPNVFLVSRLFPDMFAFTKQVQLVSDFAKNTSARLAGVEIPKFEDNETTIDQLKARLAKTTDFLKSLKPAQIDGTEAKDITFPVGGQPMTLKGQDYLIHFAMPNFYFHATTAYAILRHNGLDVGKRDFMGRR